MNEMIDTIIHGDVLQVLRTLESESIDAVVTSPPYWQLRNYGYPEQWGLEKTYEEYLSRMWDFMDETRRVLKPTGTVWINLGDTFGTNSGNMRGGNKIQSKQIYAGNALTSDINKPEEFEKCLLLIPARFAIGCIDRGWILRNEIIWAKPNGLPESVKDRFSKKHEMIYFFVKNRDYYFDLTGVKIATKYKTCVRDKASENYGKINKLFGKGAREWIDPEGKNPGDVTDFWKIPIKASKKKHYATYNYRLIDTPIIAGCPPDGVVLDPFCGSGTTCARAAELGRHYIGIDASAEYVKQSREAVANCKPELFR